MKPGLGLVGLGLGLGLGIGLGLGLGLGLRLGLGLELIGVRGRSGKPRRPIFFAVLKKFYVFRLFHADHKMRVPCRHGRFGVPSAH